MELEATITERRRQTRGSIYRYIYDETGFCTKQSVATALKLSLPTVYQNLNELVDAGLAEYSGEQRSTGGRKAMGLRIVPGARFAVGVSITDDRLKLTAADLRLKETAYRRVSHPPVKEHRNCASNELSSRQLLPFAKPKIWPSGRFRLVAAHGIGPAADRTGGRPRGHQHHSG